MAADLSPHTRQNLRDYDYPWSPTCPAESREFKTRFLLRSGDNLASHRLFRSDGSVTFATVINTELRATGSHRLITLRRDAIPAEF